VLEIVRERRAAPAPQQRPAEQDEFARVKRFDAAVDVEPPDAKKMLVVKVDDRVVDYQNVGIAGYLSTFKGTTESDRQGDYVDEGAFRETIPKFMLNPVLLSDHRNSVGNLAGNFTSLREDKKGLRVEAMLSNSPDNIGVRFKVAEGMLKTMSMGGVFHYKEDGRGIFKVDLWEGSLVPIPANPDARFNVRALTEAERRFMKTGGSYYDFLRAELQNHAGLADR
jgi:HK97 family phage prohead protease